MTPAQCLDYEILSSWWVGYIKWTWLLKLARMYFAWKVDRKWNRWFDKAFDSAYKDLLK